MPIRTKRAQDTATEDDGTRVLVDRYWPRGVHREQARVDEWIGELAPSPALTAWFGHRVERWEEFKLRYFQELSTSSRQEAIERLRIRAGSGSLTLIYGARDRRHNGAQVLAEYLGARASIAENELVAPSIGFHFVAAESRPSRWYDFSFSALEWMWLLFALMAPLVVLVTLEVLVIFGPRGWIGFLTVLTLFCLGTLIRVIRLERRQSNYHAPWPKEDRQSIWVAVRDLTVFAAGAVLGLVVLAIVLGLFAYSAGFLS